MPYCADKSRLSFRDFCSRLAFCGFRILAMQQYLAGDKTCLQLVVVNGRNLALQVDGPVTPPHWGEDLFYKLLTQVELFGEP